MYRLFKIWLYVKVIFEILGKIRTLIGKMIKRTIKKNVFSKDHIISKEEKTVD